MRVGLLLCDRVRPELVGISGDYPEMFRAMFRCHAPQVELAVYDIRAGIYPRSPDECDAYISSGSASSVYDNEIWIGDFEDYLKYLYRTDKKFVGICFGHQMMARALGGTVAPSDKGWGVGIKECELTLRKPWMTPAAVGYSILVSHRDQIESLPAAAEILATSPDCEIAMVQIGEHFLGIQGHPEFTPEYARALMDARTAIIPGDCLEAGRESLGATLDTRVIVDWILAFVRHPEPIPPQSV